MDALFLLISSFASLISSPILLLCGLVSLLSLFPTLFSHIIYGFPSLNVTSRHVFITGGSKGLGRSFSLQLALNHGAKVTIAARGLEEMNQVVNEIKTKGGVAQGVVCDVTRIDLVKQAVEKAEETFGKVDMVIACAGMAATGRFLERKFEDFEEQIKLNYLGTVAVCKVVLRNMVDRKQRGGRVVLVSSQCGFTSFLGYSAYAPSKYAVRALGESLRHEFLPYGIGVHVCYPGNMKTPGYEVEQLTKPIETKTLEAGEPLQEADDVAKASLESIAKGDFAVYGGNLSGFFLGRASSGLSPRSSLLLDVVLSPLITLFTAFHRAFILDPVAFKTPNGANAPNTVQSQ